MDEVLDQPKDTAWSYSRLHGFEICPRRYYENDIKKAWPKDTSPQLQWGDAVHLAMAKALKTGEPLPTVFRIFQKWIDFVNSIPGELLIEDDARWAITREFVPTPWFAKNVWLRTVADAVKLDPPVAMIVDWKGGKSANVDPLQLILTSLMTFIQFPEVHCVLSRFVWLLEDSETIQRIERSEAADQWAELMPRIKALQHATNTNNFPPRPNRFCRSYCNVKSCEYHGR